MNNHTIIKKPIITEKSTYRIENDAYTFEVDGDANRIQIKQAVEDLFDVKVRKVNTMWQRGKRKRVGRNIGTTRSFKKAIVTLEPGHKIDVFF